MSGGKRIDDHAFWAGAPEKGGVFPKDAKMKQERDSAGDGHEAYYEDTSDAIHRSQDEGARKAKSRSMKPGNRY